MVFSDLLGLRPDYRNLGKSQDFHILIKRYKNQQQIILFRLINKSTLITIYLLCEDSYCKIFFCLIFFNYLQNTERDFTKYNKFSGFFKVLGLVQCETDIKSYSVPQSDLFEWGRIYLFIYSVATLVTRIL